MTGINTSDKMISRPLPWFRMYTDFLNDSKMVSLSFEDQRHFIAVLALKCAAVLDQNCDPRVLDRIIANRLWIEFAEISDLKNRLSAARLIDEHWQPIAWDRRQYVSDCDPTAAERSRRYREKKGASRVASRTDHGCVTPPDTETEVDKDEEQKGDKSPSSSVKQKAVHSDAFEQAWSLYPDRPNNNKASAWRAWKARIASGASPHEMVDGAKRYQLYCRADNTEPRYVKQASAFFGPDEHFKLPWTPVAQLARSNSVRDQHRAEWMAGSQSDETCHDLRDHVVNI
jgi:hypothetical protein